MDRLENARRAYQELVSEATKETTATSVVAEACFLMSLSCWNSHVLKCQEFHKFAGYFKKYSPSSSFPPLQVHNFRYIVDDILRK